MIEDGYKFYLSENSFWLTYYVPSDYIKIVDKYILKRFRNRANVSDEVKNKFLEELLELYKKYNVSIGHEDSNGEFLLNNYSESDIDRMRQIEICQEELDYLNR